jgi:hypothetical protein
MEYDDAVAYLADQGRAAFSTQDGENGIAPQIGVEVEYPHAADSLQSIPASAYMQTLYNLARRPDVAASVDSLSPSGQIVGATFTEDAAFAQGSDVAPEFDYDFGPEAEIGTEITRSLEDAYRQVAAMEEAAATALSSGQLYRQGLLPGLVLHDDFDDPIDWDIDRDDATAQAYETPKIRYRGLEEWYSLKNMGLGGTGSIQVTSTPRMDGDVDAAMTRFLGGDDVPGIPALSPLFFAPFANSPVITEGELQWQYGREIAYQMGRVNSPIIDADEGFAKFGYYPEWAEVDGLEDVVRINAEKPYEFTMPVAAAELQVDGNPIHERNGFDHIDAETAIPVLAAEPTDEGYDPTTLKTVIEEQRVDGSVQLKDTDGDWHDIPVTLDYTDMEEDTFMEDVLPDLYGAIEGTNVPNWRPKLGVGVVESRDFCNNPSLQETVAMQAAVFQEWRELQDIAAGYGITEDDADELRIGVARDGVRYEISPGVEVRDVLDDMQETLRTGALKASQTGIPADMLDTYLDDVIQTGITPAEGLYGAYLAGTFTERYKEGVIRRETVEDAA